MMRLHRQADQAGNHARQVEQADKHFNAGHRACIRGQRYNIANPGTRQQRKAKIIKLGPSTHVLGIDGGGISARLKYLDQHVQVSKAPSQQGKGRAGGKQFVGRGTQVFQHVGNQTACGIEVKNRFQPRTPGQQLTHRKKRL